MNNSARAIALSLLALAVAVSAAAESGNPPCRVQSGNLQAAVSPDGQIAGLQIGKESLPITAETIVEGCRTDGNVQQSSTPDGGCELRRNLVHQRTRRRCELTERIRPGPGSIRWEVEIHGDGAPWTTPISTRLIYRLSPASRFWTPWRYDNQDPLTPIPMPAAVWEYGTGISLPLASVLDEKTDRGVSLILSPEDTLLDVHLVTTTDGRVTFQRLNHRLGQGRTVRFATDIVVHEADWRGGLRWMTNRYAPYFDSPNPKAPEMAGCGAYAHWTDKIDVQRLRRMSFRIFWDASFQWPYYGMFLPPADTWQSLGQDGGGTPQLSRSMKMSYALMNQWGRQLHEAGFVPLSYFILCDFGAGIFGKQAAPNNLPPNEQWKDQIGLLRKNFADSVYRDSKGQERTCWGGDYVMDPAGAGYKAHLCRQARLHVKHLPDWAGLACDRLAWPGYGANDGIFRPPWMNDFHTVNFAADDGVGWYDGRAGRHFTISFKEGMAPVAAIVHRAGKIITYNVNMACRLDCYKDIDGFFDEGGSVSAAAMLGLHKPVTIWTACPEVVKPDPDGYFQRHLRMGAYPMAPCPGADHSILPDPSTDKYYLDYGPLLDAIRGKKWVLEPHCIEVNGGAALVNLFEVPGGYVAPVTFGGKAKRVTVRIRNVAGLSAGTTCRVLHPGSDKWQPLSATLMDGLFQVNVPLQRGCAMLKMTW